MRLGNVVKSELVMRDHVGLGIQAQSVRWWWLRLIGDKHIAIARRALEPSLVRLGDHADVK